ncbi:MULTISPECIES: GNAT family N-acetyltransferase [Acidianus]|uniref:N-acetyltransferase domain-containing protein n=1 Tax=Candidatus Acidianus copahuensis TaxID=1160895 RepID=A0A031LJF6_9CREN|nr:MULTISPECIES: GNAT family N-acetyltransferase [Acidianus]EZQ02274.1 hypothetical protein CM19_10705 [Candidatus Acidianus copahuensis]NON63020.1 GNAT family N-acetyltransferase [Acidianus sp. RZ1]
MDKYGLKDYYIWNLQGDEVYVIDVNGEIAGVVDIIEGLDYIIVDMLARNKLVDVRGIGSSLLSFAEDYAKSKMKHKVIVEALDTAKDFYLKKGYTPLFIRDDNEWGKLTVMVKYVEESVLVSTSRN